MTPKPKRSTQRESTKTTHSMEEMQSETNSKLSELIEKFEQLEASLLAVTQEKEILKVTVSRQAIELAELRNSLNEREQYARSWSMRVLNVPVPIKLRKRISHLTITVSVLWVRVARNGQPPSNY